MSYVRDVIAQPEDDHPGWWITMVPTVVGPDHWCAGRHGTDVSEIIADSPAQLDEAITNLDT